MTNGREEALDTALRSIRKRFGDGAVMRLGEATHLDVEAILTGSLSLDIALGIGGIPRGRITETYGPEGSGKTTLCLHIVAQIQQSGGTAAIVDVEHALDPAYAEICSVSVDELYISQPDTAEEALEIAEALIRSGGVDALVIDSVAALVPRSRARWRTAIPDCKRGSHYRYEDETLAQRRENTKAVLGEPSAAARAREWCARRTWAAHATFDRARSGGRGARGDRGGCIDRARVFGA
jgi:RecA/RadA recombinase